MSHDERLLDVAEVDPQLKQQLEAFLQTATQSLLQNTAGVKNTIPERQ